MNIANARLFNQHLSGDKFDKPQDVVDWLGAVQAQDFPAAKWALGIRIQNTTDEIVEKAYNDGLILRTHVMRPTWHFVMPEDIRWMEELTSPRVKALMASYNRKLELTDELFAKSSSVIVKALKNNNFLTRQELKKILLERLNIKTDVQRLAHIIMWAELDAIICSGPRRGKQFTYALLEERVPKVKKINRDESLAKLALKYFTSHGPAQLKDFAWWSGLTVKDALIGLDLVKSRLSYETIDGPLRHSSSEASKTYWFPPELKTVKPKSSRAFLLSIYDEYTIAYKDRSALGDGRYFEKLILMGNALTSVIILDGKIAGTWKRTFKKDAVNIKLGPFFRLDKSQSEALSIAAEQYGKFLGLSTLLI